MGETPDQIERHIYEKRSELGENIHELQHKVKNAVDWRAQFDERPWTMIGLAFGGGLLASILIGGARNSYGTSRSRDRWKPESQRSIDSDDVTTRQRDSAANATWENIRGAALAVLGTRLGSLLEGVLPGFQDQYRKRQREQSSTTSRANGPEAAWRKNASAETDYAPQS